jgi:hypothetical protein
VEAALAQRKASHHQQEHRRHRDLGFLTELSESLGPGLQMKLVVAISRKMCKIQLIH